MDGAATDAHGEKKVRGYRRVGTLEQIYYVILWHLKNRRTGRKNDTSLHRSPKVTASSSEGAFEGDEPERGTGKERRRTAEGSPYKERRNKNE